MRCDFCQGSGLVVLPNPVAPCSECGGFGVLQPCEGLRAQPASEPKLVANELDDDHKLAGWKSLTTEFPFKEANTSLG